ncbi:translation initiation factor IF-2-like [Corvus kubaryi]|uniref:translation initiation factor IF-2-like n=1 Tax=Corvus kubaryi TaxID=68294 RepID=UPI001C05DC52|nr:translation initiation factor IF-2-like [Corvus kubaryi]
MRHRGAAGWRQSRSGGEERAPPAAAGSPPALPYGGHGNGCCASALRCGAVLRSAPLRPVSLPARRRSPARSRLPPSSPRMWRSGRSGTLLLTLRRRRGLRRGAAGGSRPGKWPRWGCPSPPRYRAAGPWRRAGHGWGPLRPPTEHRRSPRPPSLLCGTAARCAVPGLPGVRGAGGR